MVLAATEPLLRASDMVVIVMSSQIVPVGVSSSLRPEGLQWMSNTSCFVWTAAGQPVQQLLHNMKQEVILTALSLTIFKCVHPPPLPTIMKWPPLLRTLVRDFTVAGDSWPSVQGRREHGTVYSSAKE